MTRIPPSAQLDQLVKQLRDQHEGTDLTSALLRAGARKTIQELLEAEATELLGRDRYERRAAEWRHRRRQEKSPLTILEERYARGEIDAAECAERREVLLNRGADSADQQTD